MAFSRSYSSVLALVVALAACGGLSGSGDPPPAGKNGPPGNQGGQGGQPPPAGATSRYPGHGFVVHEWGTNTIVVGSDGSLQRGLHHEEESLPPFAYDRIKGGSLDGNPVSAEVKMETPVTYFYSDVPLTVHAQVAFPKGVFTQWFPRVNAFEPLVAWKSSVDVMTPSTVMDPVLDVHFPFRTQSCRDTYAQIQGGKLDWGDVQVLARGATATMPDAPLDKYTWSFARQVDSNAVRVQSGESEQFLFYRGLGAFEDLPVAVHADNGGHVSLTNMYKEKVPTAFVLNVGATNAAFTARWDGIAPGARLDETAPSLEGAPALDAYAASLGDAVTRALDATGLYHDEAVAMVSTWQRQWFRTPGVRLLYIVPQSWTDASIPLTLEPAPASTTRVMLIRVEMITPELEAADTAQAKNLDVPASADAARAYFTALGRFAEPRLRRAIQVLGAAPGATTYLATIASASTDVTQGE
jgi:hypothetical protein